MKETYSPVNAMEAITRYQESIYEQTKENTERLSKLPFYNIYPMPKHTNLDNEIDGSNHYMKSDRLFDGFDWTVAIGTVAMIVGAGVIYLMM